MDKRFSNLNFEVYLLPNVNNTKKKRSNFLLKKAEIEQSIHQVQAFLKETSAEKRERAQSRLIPSENQR
jgi:hypothetical protein